MEMKRRRIQRSFQRAKGRFPAQDQDTTQLAKDRCLPRPFKSLIKQLLAQMIPKRSIQSIRCKFLRSITQVQDNINTSESPRTTPVSITMRPIT